MIQVLGSANIGIIYFNQITTIRHRCDAPFIATCIYWAIKKPAREQASPYKPYHHENFLYIPNLSVSGAVSNFSLCH
jgi:hypothetical protein